MSLLPCVEPPVQGEPRGAVLWLHGLGASGHDFEPIVPLLGLPDVRFVFPHAPPRPVTINGGMVMPSWYDIRSLDDRPDRESKEDIRASAEQISALLEREHARGLPYERIVLAGFSQGGALTLHVGARFPHRLAGLMVLSAYLLLPEAFAAEREAANRDTPALFCHGRFDPLVPMERGRRAFEALQEWSPERPALWQDYAMEHEVCPPQISAIAGWLAERFPPV